MSSPPMRPAAALWGGPAGMVLGLLLARVGVPVTLLESPPDFDRNYRGDTVHPSTLELLAQLGLAERHRLSPASSHAVQRPHRQSQWHPAIRMLRAACRPSTLAA